VTNDARMSSLGALLYSGWPSHEQVHLACAQIELQCLQAELDALEAAELEASDEEPEA
jgi:hypothetical protein